MSESEKTNNYDGTSDMQQNSTQNKKRKESTRKWKKVTSAKDQITALQEKYTTIDVTTVTQFQELPLSSITLKGLKKCKYIEPTDIQRETIRLALEGKDVLGAAQTGSGKTLAFLVPVLERLFCTQWTGLDGLGALIITPTRELAYQIFETLRRVGEFHDFSAGLIIGGKDLKFERDRMDKCNIVIGTPGRILQHMDENPLFDCVNLQILIMDEADRCLDMGFEATMNAIIANLPERRQTLLFSATQTKSVRDLSRLSLRDPSYISVHEQLEHSTPSGLKQAYIVCQLEQKISILWSFLRNHLKKKIIVFFASCKQTKYTYEMFTKLRLGVGLMALYGSLHQLRRMDIYEQFCRKSAAVLFATDLAARGLDFPEVNWVVQMDCPEDAATYIHRVGRTARYHRGGESLLLLLPSEVALLDDLQQKRIPIDKIDVNPLKLQNPVRKMNAFLAKNVELRCSAQRAFVSYVKSVFLMKNKKVFNVNSLNTDAFSESLGLEVPPRIRFLQRYQKRLNEQNNLNTVTNDNNSEPLTEEIKIESKKNHFKVDLNDLFELEEVNHDWKLPIKSTDDDLTNQTADSIVKIKPSTKIGIIKKQLHTNVVMNKKIVFNDDTDNEDDKSQIELVIKNETDSGIDIEKAKIAMKEADKVDRKVHREKVKMKHKKVKEKLRNTVNKLQKNEDDFSADDKNYEDDYEPDLSWLPDPDIIYCENTVSDVRNLETEGKSTEKMSTTKKRKKKQDNSEETNLPERKKKTNKLSKVAESLNITETEELAMILLKQNG